MKLYRLQVYDSITHHLYIVLCVHHPKPGVLPSAFIPPLYPLLIPPAPLSEVAFLMEVFIPCVHLLRFRVSKSRLGHGCTFKAPSTLPPPVPGILIHVDFPGEFCWSLKWSGVGGGEMEVQVSSLRRFNRQRGKIFKLKKSVSSGRWGWVGQGRVVGGKWRQPYLKKNPYLRFLSSALLRYSWYIQRLSLCNAHDCVSLNTGVHQWIHRHGQGHKHTSRLKFFFVSLCFFCLFAACLVWFLFHCLCFVVRTLNTRWVFLTNFEEHDDAPLPTTGTTLYSRSPELTHPA